MSKSRYILSIDLGSSGPKVALVGEDGEIAACAVRSVETQVLPPDGSEQDPEAVWRAVVDAAKQVVHEAGKPAEAIVGVGCDSQYFSIVPIDEAGLPTMNMLHWMDARGAPQSMRIYETYPEAPVKWVDIHGMPPLPTGTDSLSHMLFIKAERPEVYERTHKFVEPVDYVTTRLTGNCVANPCTVFPLLLTDNRDLEAVEYHDELLAMSGMDREKLPDLVATGSCIGTVREDVAREIGLSPDTKVFSGTNDTQAVYVGTGTFLGNHGGISIGTTCQVLGPVAGLRVDIENSIVSMPSPVPGGYMAMAENGLGGKLLDHFLRNVAFANDALTDHSTVDMFSRVDEAVAAEPAGSGDLLFLPWLTGAQCPVFDPNARGGFLNMSLETTRARMVRAVLEGVTFNLRWLLPAVERFSERDFGELHFAGGGAVSDQWSQILADIMDRPVSQLADALHVNTRATAFLAFEQLGMVDMEEISNLCPIKQVYEPKPENRAVYDRLFEQFVAAYERNAPIFAALNG